MEPFSQKCLSSNEALRTSIEKGVTTCYDIDNLTFPITADAISNVCLKYENLPQYVTVCGTNNDIEQFSFSYECKDEQIPFWTDVYPFLNRVCNSIILKFDPVPLSVKCTGIFYPADTYLRIQYGKHVFPLLTGCMIYKGELQKIRWLSK